MNPITGDECKMSSGIETCYCSDEDFCNGSETSCKVWTYTVLLAFIAVLSKFVTWVHM